MTKYQKIGLLAGWGRYPIVVAEALEQAGVQVYCLGFHEHADPKLKKICTAYLPVSPFRIRPQIAFLKKHGVTHATMAGKLFKTRLFQRHFWLKNIPDWIFLKYYRRHLFFSSRDNNDDTLLSVVVRMFGDYGVDMLPATDFAPELLVNAGTLTKRRLSPAQDLDVQYGWRLAKEMGRLDVGQCVCVKNRAVLAVEAVEGTDDCVRRAGQLCSAGGFSVIKVAKPQQDMRFDVPTIGVGTIQTMFESGAKVLALESDKTIVLDQQQVISLANQLGISIVAYAANAMPLPGQQEKAA